MLIHAVTVKGKGYSPAELSDDCYHGRETSSTSQNRGAEEIDANAPAYTSVFGSACLHHAQTDAASVGVHRPRCPAALAPHLAKGDAGPRCSTGGSPNQQCRSLVRRRDGGRRDEAVCAIYSSFFQRGYDPGRACVALQNLPVRFMTTVQGWSGPTGRPTRGTSTCGYSGGTSQHTVMALRRRGRDGAHDGHPRRPTAAHRAALSARRRHRRADARRGAKVLEIRERRVIQEGRDVAILSFGAHSAHGSDRGRPARSRCAGLERTIRRRAFRQTVDHGPYQPACFCRACGDLITVEQGAVLGIWRAVLHHSCGDRAARPRSARSARCTFPTASSTRQAGRYVRPIAGRPRPRHRHPALDALGVANRRSRKSRGAYPRLPAR